MNADDVLREERKVALARWADRYAAQFDRHVAPLLVTATDDFVALAGHEPDWDKLPKEVTAEVRSALWGEDVARLALLPAGVGVAAAGTTLAVRTVAVKVFWVVVVRRVTVIVWPVLLAGLGVGALLSWCGVHWLGGLQARLRGRLKKQLYPQVKAALVGEGTDRKGVRIASLKGHLIGRVKEAALTALLQFDEGEVTP